MIDDTITTDTARRFYDWLGRRHDWAERYESRAKARALELLDVTRDQSVLNVGAGTGKEHVWLQTRVIPRGVAVDLDISPVMLRLVRARTGAPVCQGDAHKLPFRDACFDGLLCTYLLDLVPTADFPEVLGEFRRVLRPGGRAVLVTLTEGVSPSSRVVVALWKTLYRLSPLVCGGCRPLRIADLVRDAGFADVRCEIVVQLAVPSEVVVAVRS
jgi:demethylmenaquinone methyltransferase/2-methoxy-6-polyprenyl-1,4-benzoquinol methylase